MWSYMLTLCEIFNNLKYQVNLSNASFTLIDPKKRVIIDVECWKNIFFNDDVLLSWDMSRGN